MGLLEVSSKKYKKILFIVSDLVYLYRMNQKQIYDKIKSLDNSALWSFCAEIAKLYKQIREYIERERENKNNIEKGPDFPDDLLDDKEALRTHVMRHLFTESEKGNAQASDKLTKIAGLDKESRDIVIEIISFKDVKPTRKKTRQTKAKQTKGGASNKGGIGK